MAIENLPKHVGIIMDGNGRWAQLRGLKRIEGHRRGAERAKDIIKVSLDIGIEVLTLYAFSIENWQRPEDEVTTLMELLEVYLSTELLELVKEGIRFRVIGNRQRLPEQIQMIINDAERLTEKNSRLNLVLALSYSGRDEIIRAIKRLIESGLGPEEINETVFEGFLDTKGLPPVDLIIRTSGEIRISNFLLWQGAYAELYFTETLWPDFTKEEFMLALQDFQRRERRFGTVLSP
ncbi:MAG: isoprenyl transferase [Nitrospirae bacterium]|nr:MAG: isoprenyl transferase [Nitrospirota bacterium]